MLSDTLKNLPCDFHGLKLLERLRSGFFSEVYLAETPEETDLPRKLCITIATSQSLGHHSHESVLNDFWYQKKILKDIQHPFIVKGFSTILAEIPDCLATELGVCTLQELQANLDSHKHEWSNRFSQVAVKYFASQVFLAVSHLHTKCVQWHDAKQCNIIIMPDFTIRLIDVGTTFIWTGTSSRDHFHVAGTLHNLSTGSGKPYLNRTLEEYKDLFQEHSENVGSVLQELLDSLLRLSSFQELLGHPYWSSAINDDPVTSLDLAAIHGNEIARTQAIRTSAWESLPIHSQQWLTEKGVSLCRDVKGVSLL